MTGRCNAPLRLALVFPGCVSAVGGAEAQALQFLAGCDRERVAADLVFLGANPAFAARARGIPDLPVHELRPGAGHVWRPDVLAAYVGLVRERRYDVVHLYGLRQEIATRPLTRLAGRARVVSAIRGTEDHRTGLQRALNRATARWVDLWIANSAFAGRVFADRDGLPADRITVVHNGIDLPGVAPGPHRGDDFVIGCVANHYVDKRIGDLVEVLPRLVAAGIDAKLVLVGRTTDLTGALSGQAEQLGVRERLEILGYRPDARDLLPGFSVLALPSQKESFPSSLLEGMAAGLPVVAAATAGVPELVDDGVTGLLHAPGDVAALQAHLAALARDPERRREMGAAGAERAAREFSRDTLVSRLAGVYEDLLAGRREWT